MDILKQEIPVKFKQDPQDIKSLQGIIGKYVQVNGHYHQVTDVEPVEDDKYIVKFAAGTEGTIGGEFYPATEDEIKELQYYIEDDGKDNSYITTENKKVEEDVNSGSLEDAINMLNKVFDSVENAIENKGTLDVNSLKDISNYVGTTLDVLQDLNNNGVFVSDKKKNESSQIADESIKVEAKNGTDRAVDAILAYHKDGNDKELNEDWLNQDIQITLANTEELYNAMHNTRRPAHSVAYQGLLQTLKTKSGEDLTGNQIQAGFRKLGLDFKQVIKPSVDYVEEERNEDLDESKKVEEDVEMTADDIINPQDSDYYENEFNVSVYPGVGTETKPFIVFANDEQQALEILSAYLEQQAPGYLLNCEDVEPEETDLIYVDGTEYGATKPYYLNILTNVEPKTEGHKITNDKNLDAIKDNFNPPGSKKEEADGDESDIEDNEDEEFPTTVYDAIANRVGQSLSVGELNTILQSIFGKYDTIFLTYDDIYNIKDWDEPQELTIFDDGDMYTLTYKVNMKDIENPSIEITDVDLD